MTSYLSCHIFISAKSLKMLSDYTHLHGLPSADHACDLLIRKALEDDPGVAAMGKAVAASVKKTRADFLPEPTKTQDTDDIP